ncbi:sulfotransferase family protein [Erythrobacter sp.]|uniref:sulfotransferase family protein n=1 Tax=Erythrobacter sp. TaxID=1042 RepID=UPI002EB6A953|nr:sulfotransferase [Erythrobacter sp.]
MTLQYSDIDFLIIGAGKSATTWLQMQLQADPAVYMVDPELHYFSREYERGDDWYLSQFSEQGIGKLVGEKSNSYLDRPEAAARIHAALPHVKLIAQLRNPADRAYSHYCMQFGRGEVGPDIENYLDPAKCADDRLLSIGNYAAHLRRFVELFGREKLLVLLYENVAVDPEAQMARARAHLGLPARPLAASGAKKVKDKTARHVPANIGQRLSWMKPMVRPLRGTPPFEAVRNSIAREIQYPSLGDKLRQKLNDHYAPSIEELQELSGESLDHWYDRMSETA